MLLTALLEPGLRRIPFRAGLLLSSALFFLTRNVNAGEWGFQGLVLGQVPPSWYQNLGTAALGFPPAGFFSGDYFSLFPWIFLYLAGWFLYEPVMKKRQLPALLEWGQPGLEWLGRHSLPVYLAHQPLLLAVMELAAAVGR